MERKEVKSLQIGEGLELPVKQMEQAGWREAQGAWPWGRICSDMGTGGLGAESLLCGHLSENQDGEFFPQTGPPASGRWQPRDVLRRVVTGIEIGGDLAIWLDKDEANVGTRSREGGITRGLW